MVHHFQELIHQQNDDDDDGEVLGSDYDLPPFLRDKNF